MNRSTVESNEGPDILSVLGDTALFSGMSDEDARALGSLVVRQAVDANQCLFRQNDSCSALYVVESGHFKLLRLTRRGTSRVVDFVGAGALLAEDGLLCGAGYLTTAIALQASVVLAIKAGPFVRYLQSKPRLAWNMLVELSRRTDELLGRIEDLTGLSAEQRIAAYLLDAYDPQHPDDSVTNGVHRRADLANLLAITPETLCRVIAAFKRRRWIEVGKQGIVIRDPKSLTGLIS